MAPRLAWWLGGITTLALAVRLAGIDSLGDLDFDEQASFFIGSMPVADMLAYLRGAPFEHPPLFYLLFHCWLAVTGSSETAMRLFAVLPGTLAVPIVGVLAGRAGGFVAGIVAALIVAAAPLHVFYSRDARMYSLLALLVAIVLACATNGRDRLDVRALGVAAAVAGLATHYYFALALIGVGAGWLALEDRAAAREPSGRRGLLVAVLGVGIAGLAGGAWIALSPGLRASLSVAYPRVVDPAHLARIILESLGAALAGPLAPLEWSRMLGGVVLALVVWQLRAVWRDRHAAGAVGVDGLRLRLRLLALCGFTAVSVGVPLLEVLGRGYAPRFVCLAVPFFAVWLGLALREWARPGLVAVGIAGGALALIGLLPMYGGYVRGDYGRAMDELRGRVGAGDAIVLNGPWQELLYRRYGWGLPERHFASHRVPLEPAEAQATLTALARDHARLWVVDAATDATDPSGFVVGWLGAHAYAEPVTVFRNALLRPYLTDARGGALDGRSLGVSGLELEVESVALERWVLAPRGESRLLVRARPAEGATATGHNYRLSAQLVGQDGGSIWHWDGPLVERGSAFEYRAGLRVPMAAQAGHYALRLEVYEPKSAGQGVARISEPIDVPGGVRVS